MNFSDNNETRYSVIIPSFPSDTIMYAERELKNLFKEATGATFADGAIAPFISIGNTAALKNSGFAVTEEEVGKTGFALKTDSCGNLFIFGATDLGTLNGVYGFLEKTLNFDYFAKGVYHIDNVADVPYRFFDVKEKPSFDYRQVNYAELREDKTSYRRMRTQPAPERYVTGNEYHNSVKILTYKRVLNGENKDAVVAEYTEKGWINNGQLCYSSAAMRAEYVESLKLYLKSPECNLNNDVMVLGTEDSVTRCECDKCKAAPSKVYAEFLNEVAKEINAGRTEKGEKPITFLMFAYYYTLQPPVGITFDKYAGVMFAPIKARFTLGLEDPENAMYEEALKGWKALTDNIYGWTYNAYFGQTLVMYDTFGVMKQNYKTLLKYGVKGLYDQTESYMAASTAFGRLKGYLQSKLLWNVNYDVDALTDKFFENVYGCAASAMKAVFNENREYYKKLYAEENVYAGQTGKKDSDKTKYSEASIDYTTGYKSLREGGKNRAEFKAKLEKWLSLMNAVTVSDEIAERIKLETLQYRYLYITLYGESDAITIPDFKNDIARFGIAKYKEGKTVEELYKAWESKK